MPVCKFSILLISNNKLKLSKDKIHKKNFITKYFVLMPSDKSKPEKNKYDITIKEKEPKNLMTKLEVIAPANPKTFIISSICPIRPMPGSFSL